MNENGKKDLELVSHGKRSEGAVQVAQSISVTNDNEEKVACNYLVEFASIRKDIEIRRKALVDPLNRHVRWINDQAKLVTVPLANADKLLDDKVKAYRSEKERKRQEELMLARIEHEQMKEDADALGIEDDLPPAPVSAPVVQTPVRVEGGKVASRKDWKYEVTDFSKLADEFKVENPKTIREAIRRGARDIPGLRVFEEETLMKYSYGDVGAS